MLTILPGIDSHYIGFTADRTPPIGAIFYFHQWNNEVTGDEILSAGDKALYGAKRARRDCIMAYHAREKV